MSITAADTSSYFLSINTKLSRKTVELVAQGAPSTPPSTVQSRGAAAGASSLLTQVTQTPQLAASAQQSKKKPKVGAVHLIERARHIRSQPKNTSPIDASKHPSLLPRQLSTAVGKKCLILDVDETLVHSSYQPTHHYDLHLPLKVNGSVCNVYVAYRPHLLTFLQAVAPLFEVVIFTASVSMYCDPVMNAVDRERILGPQRLFREHCVVNGSYVKDLSLLGRPLDTVCIIDNSPVAYLFQQRNAIPILSWFDDPNDEELLHLIPVLTELAKAPTVYDVLDNYNALVQLQQEIAQQDAIRDL